MTPAGPPCFPALCRRRWRGWLWRGCPANQLVPGVRGPHWCAGKLGHASLHICIWCGAVIGKYF